MHQRANEGTSPATLWVGTKVCGDRYLAAFLDHNAARFDTAQSSDDSQDTSWRRPIVHLPDGLGAPVASSGGLFPDAAEHLSDWLRSHDHAIDRIVLVIRSTAEFLERWYRTTSSGSSSFTEFLQGVDLPALSWTSVIQTLTTFAPTSVFDSSLIYGSALDVASAFVPAIPSSIDVQSPRPPTSELSETGRAILEAGSTVLATPAERQRLGWFVDDNYRTDLVCDDPLFRDVVYDRLHRRHQADMPAVLGDHPMREAVT